MRTSILLLALLLAPMAAAQQYLLPAAGNHSGANGTFFRSDLSIWNFREDNQRVAVRWLPAGRSATTSEDVIITVGAFSGFFSENFVGEVLNRHELGAILFTAIRPDGTPDMHARLVVQSRIWSPHDDGTTSQSFNGIPLSLINSGSTFVITGLRADDRFRMNVGVVNLDPVNTHEFGVIPQPGREIVSVSVPPMSMVLTGIPVDRTIENFARLIRIHPRTGVDPTKWIAFGSSVDNTTGDAWSTIGYTALLP
jgi:hypothetical protein